MKTSDFHYHLPPDLIAQHPAEQRDQSRLLVLERHTGRIEHLTFKEITGYLEPGDALVLNETKVIPARLLGNKEPTGGSVEILLLRERGSGVWEALVSPGRRVGVGTRVMFEDKTFRGEVIDRLPSGARLIRFNGNEDFLSTLARIGQPPLPPYVRREPTSEDRERYQTVFARTPGAVAAPTAGLHFTEHLLAALQAKGVRLVHIVLHVGMGTFRPIKVEEPSQHEMEAEYYEITPEAAGALNKTRRAGGRVVAVGTSATRTLETAADRQGFVGSGSGLTSLFIVPPYAFRATDALLTNFHAPRSTPLLLVSAFAGRENILGAYAGAVKEHYRFLSYGDAMFIV
jgi:S-adenosylmethionine:tRNA ribosyltransferase-isomerase